MSSPAVRLPPLVPLDPAVATDVAQSAAALYAWLRETRVARHLLIALRAQRERDVPRSPAATIPVTLAGLAPAVATAYQALWTDQMTPGRTPPVVLRSLAATEALLEERREALLLHLAVAGATAPGAATRQALVQMDYTSMPSWSDEIHPPMILLLASLEAGRLDAAALLQILATSRLKQSLIEGVTRAVATRSSGALPLARLRTIGVTGPNTPFVRLLGELLAVPPAAGSKTAQALAHRMRTAVVESLVRLAKTDDPVAASVAATLLDTHVLTTPTQAGPWTALEVASLPWLEGDRFPTPQDVDAFAARLTIPPYRAHMGARKEVPFLQAMRRLLGHPATAWYAMPVLWARATTPEAQWTLLFHTGAITLDGPWTMDDAWVASLFASVAAMPDTFPPSDDFHRLSDVFRRTFGRGDPDRYLQALLRWEHLANQHGTFADDYVRAICVHPTWTPSRASLPMLLMSSRPERRQIAHTIIAASPDAPEPTIPEAATPDLATLGASLPRRSRTP